MKDISIALFCILFLVMLGSPLSSQELIQKEDFFQQSQSILYVDDDNFMGPWDGSQSHPFQHIQDAVDHAQNNQIIHVNEGMYPETVVVNKPLTIQGQDSNTTIIDGRAEPYVMSINHDAVQISHLTIQHSGGSTMHAGINLNASQSTIDHCRFYLTKSGIISINQTENTFSHCEFHKNGEGIYLSSNRNDLINSCLFYQNGLGVNLYNTEETWINSCMAHTNGIGFYVESSSDIIFDHCGAYNNNDNQGGIFLETCMDVNIEDCIISHNGFGIKTSTSHDIKITNSTFSYNTHAGILNTDQSKNITVSFCEFTKNLRISIHNTESQIILTSNNIYNSICGLYSEKATAIVEHNWWGSICGPGKIERKQQDNIKKIESSVDWIPWAFKKINLCGATWNIPEMFESVKSPIHTENMIVFDDVDSDNDIIPNWWEEQYGYDPTHHDDHIRLDPDEDGLNNIEECFTSQYGSHPFIKDIFLEFDWMECRTSPGESNKPNETFINMATQIFSLHNITLHIDVGNLGGGEQIPYMVNFSFADLRDIYWDYFLHADMKNPRKGIFHYGIICDYGPANGFAFIGWDSLDSFCICAETLKRDHEINYPRQRFIMGSSIHELGHTMGLTVDDHGGNDNKISTIIGTKQWLKYLTYPSCMNYFYTYLILGFSDGTHGPGDFDDWDHLDFSFFKNTHYILPERYR